MIFALSTDEPERTYWPSSFFVVFNIDNESQRPVADLH